MYASYNYPYYPEHMEKLGGFEKDNDYVQSHVRVPEVVPEKFSKLAQMVEKRFNLHVHKLTRHELMKEGYGHEVFNMLNITYNDLYGFAPQCQDGRAQGSRHGHRRGCQPCGSCQSQWPARAH